MHNPGGVRIARVISLIGLSLSGVVMHCSHSTFQVEMEYIYLVTLLLPTAFWNSRLRSITAYRAEIQYFHSHLKMLKSGHFFNA